MKLHRTYVEKPWGRIDLPARFDRGDGARIGEIWFDSAGTPLPLLIKYLFTSEKLSVQVHPSDDQALAMGLPGGKEECWLVIDAEPDATIGIGTDAAMTADDVRAGALSGAIEQRMTWKPVRPGDFFYIPAGTIHAIGAGVTLIEIQQNADVTFRLYDYGRPRALHLDEGVAVARAEPFDAALHRRIDVQADAALVDGPYFALRLCGASLAGVDRDQPLYVAPLAGSVRAGDERANAGDCLYVPAGGPLTVDDDARLLVAWACSANLGAIPSAGAAQAETAQ